MPWDFGRLTYQHWSCLMRRGKAPDQRDHDARRARRLLDDFKSGKFALPAQGDQVLDAAAVVKLMEEAEAKAEARARG